MNRLMLDFETLDVGNMPVILSMGAVVFDEKDILCGLDIKIDQQSCIDIGCTISEETLNWWDKQSDEAKTTTFGGTTHIYEAMRQLINLYRENECCEIWSRGALADIRWANNILDELGLVKPWKFYREMCFRTFIKLSPQIEIPFEGTKHNALADAIHQAKTFIEIKKYQCLLDHLLLSANLFAQSDSQVALTALKHSVDLICMSNEIQQKIEEVST